MDPPPAAIGERAFAAGAHLVDDYLMPMAERVYGDAAVSEADRNAATLARWIVRTKAKKSSRSYHAAGSPAARSDNGRGHPCGLPGADGGRMAAAFVGWRISAARRARPVNSWGTGIFRTRLFGIPAHQASRSRQG